MSSREQFEARFPLPEHVRWDGEQYLCYSRYQIRAFLTYCDQWDAWQASRQALVVKFPEEEPCHLINTIDMIKALEDAGVKFD